MDKKTMMMALGAGLLAAAAVQIPGAAMAAKKGSERGFIRPGDSHSIIIYDKKKGRTKSLGGPDTKSKQ